MLQKNYWKRIRREIKGKFTTVLAHLNPFKPWTEDIIKKVFDSNNLEHLKTLRTILRRHSKVGLRSLGIPKKSIFNIWAPVFISICNVLINCFHES